jgi:hypothetical protein
VINKESRQSQKGQSVVESVILMLVFSLFLSAGTGGLYLVYSSYWIEHILGETLICQQEVGNSNMCMNQARAKIKKTTFHGNFYLKIRSYGSFTQIKYERLLNFPLMSEKTITLQKQMRI